jgi:hypothetical protein
MELVLESYEVAGFGVNGAEPLGPTTRVLSVYSLRQICVVMCESCLKMKA